MPQLLDSIKALIQVKTRDNLKKTDFSLIAPFPSTLKTLDKWSIFVKDGKFGV